MTDILQRLHCTIRCDIETAASECHCAEARDEITRLRALNAELVEAAKDALDIIEGPRAWSADAERLRLAIAKAEREGA